jgi:hypothetical protein
MRYYEYSPDCTIAGVGTDALGLERLGDIYAWDAPLASLWSAIAFHGYKEDPAKEVEGDFPCFYDYPALPVFSQHAWDALRSEIECRWEALPIIHPSGKPFYLIHVMETIEALDVERSQGVKRYDDGDVMEVDRYCLKTRMLVGKHVFKLSPDATGGLIVDDVFRNAVVGNALTGLEFRALPTID